MEANEGTRRALDGPPAWANWRAALQGDQTRGAVEIPLYSDAWTTGEVSTGLGPYQFFNTVATRRGRGIVRPAAVMRVELHAEFETPKSDKTDPGFYYGGWIADELAALASLLTGARFRAVGETRRFDVGGEPRGRPISWGVRPEPTLVVSLHGIVLPGRDGDVSIMPLELLSKYPSIEAADAIAIVRAARLYQDALWVAESEGNLAWIMLVSAVEAAANRWKVGRGGPLDRLIGSKPDLTEYLKSLAIDGLVERIASEFSESIGATGKFVDFLITHLPMPPEKRPEDWRRVSWEPEELRKVFRTIYGHRSRALHDGIPFPAPMCDPVMYVGGVTATPSERPSFISAHQEGGTWLAKDAPMYLHTFEYIARGALLNWLATLALPNSA